MYTLQMYACIYIDFYVYLYLYAFINIFLRSLLHRCDFDESPVYKQCPVNVSASIYHQIWKGWYVILSTVILSTDISPTVVLSLVDVLLDYMRAWQGFGVDYICV